MIRTNSYGDTLWTKRYVSGSAGYEERRSIVQTNDGGFAFVGAKHMSRYNRDVYVYLIRTNSNGDSLWAKTYKIGVGNSIQQTSDGGFIIAGSGDDDSLFGAYLLIRTDSNGDTLWTKTYGGNPYEPIAEARSVRQTNDGGFIIVGVNFRRIYLVRTNPEGIELWYKYFRESDLNDGGYSVQQTYDGGFIVVGCIELSWTGPSDIYLIRLSPEYDF